MGVPLIVVGVSILLSAAAAAYAIYAGSKGKGNKLGPAGLDGFSVTQAREGSVVPYILGRRRIPGNIIFYGNIVAEEIEVEQSGGGKGGMTGGSDAQSSGYRYYLDVWQSLCLGQATLIETYVNDNLQTVECDSQNFNDGTGTYYPTEAGEFASKLKGVAHVFHKKLLCGDNSTSVPTIHFVVDRVLDTGLPHENMTNGSNPAAAVYDILVRSGVPADQIAWDTFEEAANYWYGKGLGINLVFAEQVSVDEMINTVLGYVDGIPYEDAHGRYAISAYDPSQTISDSIVTTDFIEFSMRRPGYAQLANHFDATFIDETQAYSQRSVSWENGAIIAILDGKRVNKGLDFEAFRDIATVSQRLSEHGKRATYAAAEFSFKTNLSFCMLQPGDMVEIENDDVGIESAMVRITSVEMPEIDKNEVAFTATQVIEGIFDTKYLPAGGSEFERSPMEPSDEARYRAQVVMPYTRDFGHTPHTLFLIERDKEYESGFAVLGRSGVTPVRGSGSTGHWESGSLRTFSRKVFVVHPDYPTIPAADPINASGLDYTIDDSDTGILLFTYGAPLKLANYPVISRDELFAKNRLLFVSDAQGGEAGPYGMGIFSAHQKPEFIAFQTIESADPLPGYDEPYYFYKIKNFLRGALNSQKRDHTIAGALLHGWIVKLSDNILETSKVGAWQKILINTLYARSLAVDTTDYAPDPSDFESGTYGCSGGFVPQNIAMPGKIIVNRTSGDVEVIYWPSSLSIDGAGDGYPEEIETPSEDSAIYEGKLYLTCGSTMVELSSPNNRTTFASITGAVTVAVRHASSLVPAGAQGSVAVDDADGIYTDWTVRDGLD